MHVGLLFQVEVFEIDLAVFYVGLQWGWNRLGFNFLDVNVCKPRMLKDFFHATFRTETGLLIFIKKFFNYIYKFLRVIQPIFFLVRENYLGSLNFC